MFWIFFFISSYFLSPFFSKFSPISFSLIVSLSLIFTHTVFYSLTLSVSPRMTFVAKTIYQTFFFKHFIKYVWEIRLIKDLYFTFENDDSFEHKIIENKSWESKRFRSHNVVGIPQSKRTAKSSNLKWSCFSHTLLPRVAISVFVYVYSNLGANLLNLYSFWDNHLCNFT